MADKYSTNYFTRQEEARRNSRKLVVLFAVAVVGIIVILYIALRIIWFVFVLSDDSSLFQYYEGKTDIFNLWDPVWFLIISIVVSLIIFIAGITKTKELQGGGGSVAKMLGGTLISRSTNNLKEKQLLNVVEEMAIASGVPVPLVFVLNNENGINAFAAGLTLNDSAIAVTRGALNSLTREELQGVIGHEFSHILNGDTRLNVQLIGIIFGIMVIGIIGSKILQGTRSSRRSGGIIILFGLVLLIVGYVGSFMGRLIQSAVSRQKEFLADASSVQFTRNPIGIIGVLKKIGGYIKGSKINSATARQASHMFFGESHTAFLFSKFLATHPPIIERIKRLDPHFAGELSRIKSDTDVYNAPIYEAPVSALNSSAPILQNVTSISVKPQDIVNLIGNPTEFNLVQGRALLAATPDNLKQILNTPAGAASVIYALLMGNTCQEREKQLEVLHGSLMNKGDIDSVVNLCALTADLKEDQKLPLVEMAIPQLRFLTDLEKHNFLEIINALILADKKTTLFEFFIQWMLYQYLVRDKEDLFGKTTFFHISQVKYDILIILKTLANSGNLGNEDAARSAFKAGVEQIPELASKNHDFAYTENINFDLISTALKQLAYSSFMIKQSVVNACAYCAFADKTITIAELELLRAISLTLHCPLPPFVTDIQLS
ncbi:MAG: M48 family metallopeptidase [Syntrophaceae bacterium]|nr:M48 family metallopeptidase [Syntrophaceae bacterium]